MMWLELADIFFMKELKNPVKNFIITDRLYFSVANTRSGSHGKLVQLRCKVAHFYFNHFPMQTVELSANHRP